MARSYTAVTREKQKISTWKISTVHNSIYEKLRRTPILQVETRMIH
ncbi:hypothetical protein [Anabaena sp. UHCC 0187]|nr:hypothetical protein [Anabaena sp. UHCC 0187]